MRPEAPSLRAVDARRRDSGKFSGGATGHPQSGRREESTRNVARGQLTSRPSHASAVTFSVTEAGPLRRHHAVCRPEAVGLKVVGLLLVDPPVLLAVVAEGIVSVFRKENICAVGLVAAAHKAVLTGFPVVEVPHDRDFIPVRMVLRKDERDLDAIA